MFICLAAATAWAAAALHKEYLKKFEIEQPTAPIIEGGVFVISVTSSDEMKDVTGRYQGRTIEFFPNSDANSGVIRYSAIVGVDYGTQAGTAEMTIKVKFGEESLEKKAKITVRAGVFPSEVLHVPPRTVTPSPQDQKQIAKDRALLGRVYATKTLNKFWDPPAVMPVSNGVTSVFGTSRVYNGVKQNVHLGTDMRAQVGTPILAPLSGQVVVARFLFFTGYTVILDHGYGMFTIYGHMSKLKVKEGHVAKKGEVLGLSGATGRVSGPHLHWGVNLHGAKVDPLVLVQALK